MPADPNQGATTVKKSTQYKNQYRLIKRQKEQSEDAQINPGNKNISANSSIPNNNTNKNNNNNYKNSNRAERKPKMIYPPCDTCGKSYHSTKKCYYGPIAVNRPLLRQRRLGRQNQVQEGAIKKTRMKLVRLQPGL